MMETCDLPQARILSTSPLLLSKWCMYSSPSLTSKPSFLKSFKYHASSEFMSLFMFRTFYLKDFVKYVSLCAVMYHTVQCYTHKSHDTETHDKNAVVNITGNGNYIFNKYITISCSFLMFPWWSVWWSKNTFMFKFKFSQFEFNQSWITVEIFFVC